MTDFSTFYVRSYSNSQNVIKCKQVLYVCE